MNKIISFGNLSQFIFLGLAITLMACGSTKQADTSQFKNYKKIIKKSELFNKAHTGFQLFDPVRQKVLFEKNAERYFTPASNTKLFTFYTCLQVLQDSVPAIHYVTQNDTLIFWGTGDPSLKNPYLSEHSKVIDFLKNRPEQLFLYDGNFKDKNFGPGWSWDDYSYNFQVEKSSLPYHGNVIKVVKEKSDSALIVQPVYFSDSLALNNDLQSRSLKRKATKNLFEYNPSILESNYDNEHPWISSGLLTASLLSSATLKDIKLQPASFQIPKKSQIIYGALSDTLYKHLLRYSDNFMAEQLLLVCSDHLFGNLKSDQVIQYAKDSLLQFLSDEPVWRDGSGLSRYNLFTPRSIVQLLHRLHRQVGEERLFHLFPAGGVSGTIEGWYTGENGPYVFAKPGL